MAFDSLTHGMQSAAQCVVAIPMEEYSRAGITGFIRSVISAAPRLVLRPLVGTSQAISRAALGVRNEILPQRQRESDDKYKHAHL